MKITQTHTHRPGVKMLRRRTTKFARLIDLLLRHMDTDSVTWTRTKGYEMSVTGDFTGRFGAHGEVCIEIDSHRSSISFKNAGIEEIWLVPMAQVVADVAVKHVVEAERKAADARSSEERRRAAAAGPVVEDMFIDNTRTSLDEVSIEKLQEIILQATSRLDPDAKPDTYKNHDMAQNMRALEAAQKCLAEIRRRTPIAHMGPSGMIDGNYVHYTDGRRLRAV